MDIEAVLGVVGTMRYIFLILIALMVSFSAASYVCADTNADRSVGKITTDPNVGGKPAEEPEVEIDLLERDSRLDKKITYEARKKRVVEIIEDLEALSGVTLRAGYNKKDWQVRDRKMNIFAKDTPLRDLMRSISHVMKFKWEVSGDEDKWSYRLFMDRSTLLGIEARLAREQQMLEETRAKGISDAFDYWEQVSQMSPQELDELRKSDPLSYVLSKQGVLEPMGNLLQELPQVREALLQGKEIEIKGSDLSPSARTALATLGQKMRDVESLMRGRRREFGGPNDQELSIRINSHRRGEDINPMSDLFFGAVELESSHGDVHMPMIDPKSDIAKLFGSAMLQSYEGNRPMREVMESMGPAFGAAMLKHAAESKFVEQQVIPDDPALEKKIKLDIKRFDRCSVQCAIAEASEYAVVADCFPTRRPVNLSLPSESNEEGEENGVKLVEVLKQFGTNAMCNWSRSGNVLEFRDKQWYRKRMAQLPEEWLEAWRNELKTTGTLELATLAYLSTLTREQIEMNFMEDDVLRQANPHRYRFEPLLKLYGVLNDAQRMALFSETGIETSFLTPEQLTAFRESYEGRRGRGNRDSIDDSGATLYASQVLKDNSKAVTYKLLVRSHSASPDDAGIERAFDTPEYHPPKEEEPEKTETK